VLACPTHGDKHATVSMMPGSTQPSRATPMLESNRLDAGDSGMPQRKSAAPLVGAVMGSESDWEIMRHAVSQLDALAIANETRVVSAHRMPDDMFAYAQGAQARGLRFIIAGAGGAAHLPGMLAAKTTVPVLGVPVPSKYLNGEDSLLSIVQMPKGIPVATFAIGEAGAVNAALFAAAVIAAGDASVASRLAAFRKQQTDDARAMRVPPQGKTERR
jgi:5-(carboxyamino)imidazole ribonucleotide mutase